MKGGGIPRCANPLKHQPSDQRLKTELECQAVPSPKVILKEERHIMKTRKSFQMLALVTVLVASTLAGCASGPSKVDVSLTTYKITLSTDNVKAGEVVFHVSNDAEDQVHEFVVFKTDLAEDQLPLTAEGIVDEEGAGMAFINEVEDVAQGTSKDLTVTLEPGRYVLLCNTSENLHYSHGMHIVFTVK
jgi:uncharacterized cupredoxin-like copper-binding protein